MQSIALHIFEERYKLMIRRCIETDSPFGIVLLEHGSAEEGRSRAEAKPRMIGCTAHISQVQELSEGRMNIIVVGRDRFKIHDFKHDEPYLTGIVETLPLMRDGMTLPDTSIDGLKRCMNRYLGVLEKAGRIQHGARKLPADPITLGSLACVILHEIAASQRQALLEAEDLPTMVDDLRTLYRREIVLLEAMLSEPDENQMTSFSLN